MAPRQPSVVLTGHDVRVAALCPRRITAAHVSERNRLDDADVHVCRSHLTLTRVIIAVPDGN